MYPHRELRRLAARKTALQRSVLLRRAECVALAPKALQPIAWLDRLLAVGRRVAPLVALPFGVLIARHVFPRHPFVGTLARWCPLIFRLTRV